LIESTLDVHPGATLLVLGAVEDDTAFGTYEVSEAGALAAFVVRGRIFSHGSSVQWSGATELPFGA
jgi:hypothetical protein